MSPKKKGGGKQPAKGGFASGKLSSPLQMKGGKRDPRHILNMVLVAPMVLLCWVRRFNRDEEAFWGPYLRMLLENPEKMEELNIAAIVKRRGEDGVTEMPQKPGSTWGWSQLILILGEEGLSPEVRESAASAVISDFNEHAVRPLFDYPTRMRLGRDFTAADPAAADTALLDKDVISLMENCYEGMPLADVADDPDIMKLWWSDVGAGAEIVAQHVESRAFYEHADRLSDGAP